MKIKLWIIIAILIALPCVAKEETDIKGRVFIVTRSMHTLRLPLVDVRLYKKEDIEKFIAGRKSEVEQIREKLKWALTASEVRVNSAKEINEDARRAKNEIDAKLSELIDQKSVEEVLEIRSKASDLANKTLENLDEKESDHNQIQELIDYSNSGLILIHGAPEPISTSKTNIDGEFSFNAAPGEYALMATAIRDTGSDLEAYLWVVGIDDSRQVELSNANWSTSGSKKSLVHSGMSEGDALSAIGKSEGVKSLEEKALPLLARIERYVAKMKEVEDEKRKQMLAKQEDERQQRLILYRRNPQLAQKDAVSILPEIAVKGSPQNTEFTERASRYREEKPDFFAEPDWPVRLVEEIKLDQAPIGAVTD